MKWNKGEKVNSISCFTEGAKTSLFRCPVGYGFGWPPTSQLHQHGRGNAAACSVRLFLKLNNALAPEVSPTDSPHRGTSGMSQVKSTSTTYLPCTHDGSVNFACSQGANFRVSSTTGVQKYPKHFHGTTNASKGESGSSHSTESAWGTAGLS